MPRIVLTGATGMIGSAIVREALRRGDEVVVIVREGSERSGNLVWHPGVQVVHAELSDYAGLEAPAKDCDAFLHLAWDKTSVAGRDDVDVQVRNIQYTLDAVRLAHRMGCKAFVGAGSQAEYGPVDCDLTPSTPANPTSGYGIAKLAAGRLSRLLCGQLGMRQNWARILSVYGPKDGSGTLISYALGELKAGRSPQLTPCEQTWDYLHCDDAARALLALASQGVDGKAYPLGSGRGRRLSEYLEIIRGKVAPSVELGFGAKPYYPHQPMHLVAAIAELTQDTGWCPEIDFAEGIGALVSQLDGATCARNGGSSRPV